MFNWDDVRFFLAVGREGTLAAAGASLGLDATTVGRRIGNLERELGARLFDRTARGFVLTAAGRRLLPRAEGIEREALAVDLDLSGEDQKLEGLVRLTSTEMIATRFIAPFLWRFHERYPSIRLDVMCTNQDVDLARREADIALRLSRPRQDDIVVKKLMSIELGLYASEGYVARHGMPRAGGLAGHRFVLFADTRPFQRENAWLAQHVGDGEVVLRSDSVSSLMSAALGGLGIALLPCHVAERTQGLVRTPLEGSPEPRVMWQAVHRELQGAARIRAVLEFLDRLFTPGRDGPAAQSSTAMGFATTTRASAPPSSPRR
ncbi:LysR family transcriptional regulator [Paraliomyxa miuraensis]|uniref:LysR family transcriptional regulator n=1 Tax=Paraliomyxa miuraensis TaxID=376150 RepID=UPI002254EB77|nr:LysR family transcriptional regulator [Paraliomyxa miuraensis]MCX4244820.1 LysR family transcriptional regulator [Paraliomyxa miuraensis]